MTTQITNRTADTPTLCAIAVLAMCLVTASHEALGHGGACLASGGTVRQLSSALFRCAPASPLVDAAGPAVNLMVGTLAWMAALGVRTPASRLLLALVGAFAWFWEGGYAVRAMLLRDGDLHYALVGWFGVAPPAARIALAAAGLGLYLAALSLARTVLGAWPRGVTRTAWLAATLAALLAALLGRHDAMRGLRDAGLEIGLASAPLIWIGGETPAQRLSRDRALIVVAGIVFAAFALILGRGLP